MVSRTSHGDATSPATTPRLSTDEVWKQLDKASFAVVSHVTPTGRPRSSGVIYAVAARHLFVSTAPDSRKATQICDGDEVAVTVCLRRGGLLALVAPIPPATISFHATATVHPAGSTSVEEVAPKLAALLPRENRTSGCLLELVPRDSFLTYGVGVSLRDMTRPALALARVPVA
jgi:hypothetical protein